MKQAIFCKKRTLHMWKVEKSMYITYAIVVYNYVALSCT